MANEPKLDALVCTRAEATARATRIEEASRVLHDAHLAVADAAGAWYDADQDRYSDPVDERADLRAAVIAWRAAGEAFVKATRSLTEDDVTITVTATLDDSPVRGNAMASGDEAVDHAAEEAILADLDAGNVWAWASVRVRVTWTAPSGREYHADDYLGACSYQDEAGFRAGGYFADMVATALDTLNDDLRASYADLAAAAAARRPS